MLDLSQAAPDYLLKTQGVEILIFILEAREQKFAGIAKDISGIRSVVGVDTGKTLAFTVKRFAGPNLEDDKGDPGVEFRFNLQGHDIHMGETIEGKRVRSNELCTIEKPEKHYATR